MLFRSPDNPGHLLAHEYHNVSTTDLAAVLRLGKQLNLDGVSAYASDPAAVTSAFLAQELSLPGHSSLPSVRMLSHKGQFRSLLKSSGFNVPAWKVVRDYIQALRFRDYIDSDVYVKPVDSSGSKGVSLVSLREDLHAAFLAAMEFSRTGEVIVEQRIQHKGPQIHGEGFLVDGSLVFCVLGDQFFSPVNHNVPLSTTFPSYAHEDIIPEVIDLVKRAFQVEIGRAHV